MKIKYEKIIEKQFNQSTPIFARCKKKTDFIGSHKELAVVQSHGGGVGAGSLPTPSVNKIGKAIITSKSVYATVSIDRESMKAARTDEGAFVRFTKFPVEIATKSFNRNLERMITIGDASGSGALALGDNTTNVSGDGSTGTPYIITLASNSVMDSFEEGDLLNVNSETTDLKIVDIDIAAKTLSLVGTSVRLAALTGSGPFATADIVYMQGSKDNEMVGLRGILKATSGSLYNIQVGRRWKSYQKDASSTALSTDLMNDVVLNVKKQSGESPNLILTSYAQYIALLNLLEDHKRYPISARDPKLKGIVSFAALEYMSADGPIPVVPSRFMYDDEMFFLNDKHMELHLRGSFEWFDEDGTVFLREAGDSYEARYGGYGQHFCNPHFQGILQNLQIPA
jgi:hypothetical protein